VRQVADHSLGLERRPVIGLIGEIEQPSFPAAGAHHRSRGHGERSAGSVERQRADGERHDVTVLHLAERLRGRGRKRLEIVLRSDVQAALQRRRRDPDAFALEEESVGGLVGRQQVEGRPEHRRRCSQASHDRVPTRSWVSPPES
jgi:hypothetical protein